MIGFSFACGKSQFIIPNNDFQFDLDGLIWFM